MILSPDADTQMNLVTSKRVKVTRSKTIDVLNKNVIMISESEMLPGKYILPSHTNSVISTNDVSRAE